MSHSAETEWTQFVVVHPLRDVPEEKLDTSRLGERPLGPRAKLALFALRAYLLLMTSLVVYHAIGLAGLVGPLGR
ncbi:MAG TPA: hypothetical protein VEC38_00785 [Candidatus Binataceae bacterium]|nr:hypothetical protein [Candidatus Binataceae bacterium]